MAESPVAVDVLPPGLRHGGRQFGVGQADQHDGETANEEGEDRAQTAGGLDPAAGQDDPAPADHRAERQGQDLLAPEDTGKTGSGRLIAHRVNDLHRKALFFLITQPKAQSVPHSAQSR
ncbi:hypothetical protein D3C75_1009230 [compost metagenome]